jgi:protocatechuate 3,4-dioxygenase beta subunit
VTDPPYAYDDYRSTRYRAPSMQLLTRAPASADRHGPVFGDQHVSPSDADLTSQGAGEPIGERIVVHGSVLDTAGRPLPGVLVEIWQANAAGRYDQATDQHDAPLDPNFHGAGRCLTDGEGRYRFVTVKPGEYPWLNHPNAWRPAHVHFSVFGRSFASRLVTQMYFPGDPLLDFDPMYRAIGDRAAAERLVGRFDHEATVPAWALAYRFDVVVGRGGGSTPFEDAP